MKSCVNDIREDLTCIYNGYKPRDQHSWGPGVRDIYALHYVLSGKGYFETKNGAYTIEAGESFLIFPHMEVYYYPDSQDPWEYIWIDFRGDEAKNLLSLTNLSHSTPVVPVAPKDLEPLFHIIETNNQKTFEKERASARLRLLLSYYMEYFPKSNTEAKTDYVVEAKEYIEDNYWKTTLTVLMIAEYVKIGRTYLFRLFKEETGMSIQSYLTQYRIRRACNLLKSTQISVKSVACSVGYKDQLYFSKIFKKVTMHTPSEYREKNPDITIE
jgi:AraC-like DNA-binding protein